MAALRDGLQALLAEATRAPVARLLTGRPVRSDDLRSTALNAELATLLERYGLLVTQHSSLTIPFQVRLVEGAVIVTDHPSRWNRAQPEFVDPLWGGPALNKLVV